MYTLTGQIKADALTSKAYVQVRLNNGLDVVATSPSVTGTTTTAENQDGWIDFSITFEVPSSYYSINDLYYNKEGIVYQDKAPHPITLFKIEQCVAKGTGSASFRNLEVVKGNAIANNIVVGDADNTLIVNGGFVTTAMALSDHTNPFLDTPGLDLTALYPIYMPGKAGTYNYADNDMADPSHRASIYDLLYYNPDYYNSNEVPEDLDKFYTSQAVTAMRHDYNDENSSFLGFKGGVTGSPHGDLDIGSFVYDIYGIRWAIDMGKDDYNLLGYWELTPDGTRWNYYRKNALGHNTIVFNPEKGGNQTIGQYASAVEKNLNQPGGGYVILDMTDVYQAKAKMQT